MVKEMLTDIPIASPTPSPEKPLGMGLDKGYDFDEVRELLTKFGFTDHSRARGEETPSIKREAGHRACR